MDSAAGPDADAAAAAAPLPPMPGSPGSLSIAIERAYGFAAPRLSPLGGEGQNYLVETDGARYVLKLTAPGAGRAELDVENELLRMAATVGFDTAIPRPITTRDGSRFVELEDASGESRFARLLSFVTGEPWGVAAPVPHTALRETGTAIARLGLAFANLDLPAAHRTHRWDLSRAGEVWPEVRAIADPHRRQLLDAAFTLWAAGAAPYLSDLPGGVIHGDLNDENVLVDRGRLAGIIDFGDALVNPLVCDLAIALTYLLLDQPEPLDAGADLVAGYHSVRPLSATEAEVLFPLMCGRLAVSLVTSAKRREDAAARAAWFVTEERGWQALEHYLGIDPVAATDALAAAVDVVPYTDRGDPAEALLERRRAHISAAQPPSFREPVKFIRGRAAYLIDERGRPYLDLYNNVCHVGHCHPRVVEAGQRQMALLNTNTRYLTDAHVAYAERLAATLPPELNTVFILNSGTEANELALRLARAHTGRDDLLVLDNAYHGHTRALIQASPYKFMGTGGSGRPEPWVQVVPIPDGYRGRFKGQSVETGIAYGDEVGAIIAGLERPPGALIAESLPSCAGQIVPPDEYFRTAFAHVRDAGGICIIDEVQVGFGRVGTHFWGFEQQGVVPDIVVMGKPIGNGHPLAAVVCTPAVADSFAASGMEFFSTFGGNPVSCAIGLAVLDVIEEEGLQAHALRLGRHFLHGLRELAERHPLIGDVRGTGLFLGIELVRDRATLEPAVQETADLVEALRERRILTGIDGAMRNVIKIKPPMVLSEPDVDRALDQLDAALRSAWS